MKIKKLLLSVVALVLVFLMSVSLVGCKDGGGSGRGGNKNSAKGVVEAYVEAVIVDFSAEDFFELMHEDEVEVWAEDEEMTVQEMIDEYQYDFDENKEWYEEELGDFKVTYEILDEVDISDWEEELIEYYEEIGLELEEIKCYEVEATFDGELQTQTDSEDVCVAKIDGKWYLIDQ